MQAPTQNKKFKARNGHHTPFENSKREEQPQQPKEAKGKKERKNQTI